MGPVAAARRRAGDPAHPGRRAGARRGAVLLTSGAALWTAGRSTDLRDGVERARDALDSGGAESLLEEMRALARSRTWEPQD